MNDQRGFTLVELIVSIAIFGVVAVVAVGALLRIIDANKKSQSIKSVVNNMNFVLDTLARELRVAKNYHCNSTGLAVFPTYSFSEQSGSLRVVNGFGREFCIGGDTAISFLSSRTNDVGYLQCRLAVSYKITDGVIYKARQSDCFNSVVTYQPITSLDDIDIDSLMFYVQQVPNAEKSRATVFLRGVSGNKVKNQTSLDLQMTISQRTSD